VRENEISEREAGLVRKCGFPVITYEISEILHTQSHTRGLQAGAPHHRGALIHVTCSNNLINDVDMRIGSIENYYTSLSLTPKATIKRRQVNR